MGEERDELAPLRTAIKRMREGRGWSAGRLAARAGMPDPYLRRIESGNNQTVGIGTLQKIAAALGVTVDELLEEAGIPTRRSDFAELDELYRTLGPVERQALVRIGWTLREMRQEYETFQAGHEAADPGEMELDVLDDEPEAASQEPREPEDEGSTDQS